MHVVDASAADPDAQIEAVRTVLAEIEAGDVPELLAFNKADLDRRKAGRLMASHPGSLACSALTGRGVPELLRAVADHLRAADRTVELAVPVARGDVLAAIHREGEVVGERYEGEHVLVQARLDERGARRYAEFVRRDGVCGVGHEGRVGGGSRRGQSAALAAASTPARASCLPCTRSTS